MLDTYGRKYVEPVIDAAAYLLIKTGLSANMVTVIAFLIGIFSGIFIYKDLIAFAVIALWVSGFLDAVDGSIARKTRTSSWGTVIDITFDRIVEISVIIGLAFRFPEAAFPLLLLSTSIIISMTIFLTVGAVADRTGTKSFYYQAGLAERTEGFIFFTLMMIFSDYLIPVTYLFFGIILFTAGQRFIEARRKLS